MSAPPEASPRQRPSEPTDETKLPSGQCRYILLNPEIKGQRCACVGFSLNRSLPGVSCECGHLSCYHIKAAVPPPDKSELDLLLRRVRSLEDQLDRENHGGLGTDIRRLTRRLGELEEDVEKSKEEASQDTKGCYRNITRMWQSVEAIANRQTAQDDRLFMFDERMDDQSDALQRVDDRLGELTQASNTLEERIEDLEDLDRPRMPVETREPVVSSEQEQYAGWRRNSRFRSYDSSRVTPARTPSPTSATLPQTAVLPLRPSPPPVTQEWTVHISLLPTASQPFPFEKDTNAYKRCLSRGLHQMIVIGGTDSKSFVQAVTKAFAPLLQGRAWAPLQARLCDAETLEGLPMLRPLRRDLVGLDNYDLDFLCRHCAVCHPSGKVDSLYIAMLSETFSWNFLRNAQSRMEGLESSWAYDPVLDRNDDWADDITAPSAGDMMTSLPPLKRPASEMSLTGGGEAMNSPAAPYNENEASGSRPTKVPRTACISNPPIELQRQGVETI